MLSIVANFTVADIKTEIKPTPISPNTPPILKILLNSLLSNKSLTCVQISGYAGPAVKPRTAACA